VFSYFLTRCTILTPMPNQRTSFLNAFMERRKTSASRSTSTASTASYAAPESAQGRITGFTTSLLVPGKIALEILSGRD
jgi:hypothetical protein